MEKRADSYLGSSQPLPGWMEPARACPSLAQAPPQLEMESSSIHQCQSGLWVGSRTAYQGLIWVRGAQTGTVAPGDKMWAPMEHFLWSCPIGQSLHQGGSTNSVWQAVRIELGEVPGPWGCGQPGPAAYPAKH